MKRILFSLVFTTIAASAFSQNINFGVKAGLNMSSQSAPDRISNGYLAGFNAGLFADMNWLKFSLKPGIIFTNKGEKATVFLPTNPGQMPQRSTGRIKLNYIEVPVNLLYNLVTKPAIQLYAGGGPYLAYGLNGSLSVGTLSIPITFGHYNPLSQVGLRNPDMGINIETAMRLKKKLLIDAGYEIGFTNISYGSPGLENRVAHLSLGYLFR